MFVINNLVNMSESSIHQMRIFELHIENKNSTVGSELTISQGFSVFIPDEECGMGALLEKADQALYKAKESGKNGYVVC